MNEGFDEFMRWRSKIIDEIDMWPKQLYISTMQEAFEHKLSYSKAKHKLQSLKPELPGTYNGTAPEIFAYGITSRIIDDAIQLVRKEEGNTIVSTPPVSDRDGNKGQKRD